MVREVDLVSYLPPFLADFKEIRLTLEAENPEFVLLWKASDQVLQNELIATADEFGISRFEKLLGIFPETGDSLEVRRTRVQNRWSLQGPSPAQGECGKGRKRKAFSKNFNEVTLRLY